MSLGNSTSCSESALLRHYFGLTDHFHRGGNDGIWRFPQSVLCSRFLLLMSPVMTERRYSWLAGLHDNGLVEEEPPPPNGHHHAQDIAAGDRLMQHGQGPRWH